VPSSTILDLPPPEQEWRLAEVRRARCGYLLALHVLRLCAAGRTPTESATFLFCSRSSVYRIVNAYTTPGVAALRADPTAAAAARRAWLTPSLRRSLLALLKQAAAAYGGCRTRWSCPTLATQLAIPRGLAVSASTRRRWLHAMGGVWKRAQVIARDDDPERGAKLARIRHVLETLGKRAVGLFADELDLHLRQKVGSQGRPRGAPVKLVTPGQHPKHYLAGALEPQPGRLVHCTSPRKTHVRFRAWLDCLEEWYPQARFAKVYGVVDNYGIHKAKAVARWLEEPPRFELLFLPTYCPQANPIERAVGDVHDKCTRNPRRNRIAELVWDVEQHIATNGPWKYKLSQLYYTPEVTAAVECLAKEQQLPQAA
jgi:transposase